MDYNARVELDVRFPTDDEAAENLVDQLMDELAPYHVAVDRSPHGRVELILTVPAESLRQATSTVLAVVAAAGWDPFAVEVLPTDAFDRRSADVTVPELLSVPEAASELGVSRQRALQLVNAGQLAGVKVGDTWVIPRSAVAARAASMANAGQGPTEVLSYP